MNLSDLIVGITSGGCGLLLLLTLVQISPIKFNPWSFIAKKIGRAVNGEVISKVEQLGTDLRDLRDLCDEREADSCRTRILRFNDEILHHVNHSKEHFDHIMIDISNYEVYCDTHPAYRNNIAKLAIERIKSTYRQCGDKGTFL